MMRKLYMISKKCEEKAGINAAYLSLFLSIVTWLLIGVIVAFLIGKIGGFDEGQCAEMMKNLGSVFGILIGYVYGFIWLMNHTE